jgi:hypothetical protein
MREKLFVGGDGVRLGCGKQVERSSLGFKGWGVQPGLVNEGGPGKQPRLEN